MPSIIFPGFLIGFYIDEQVKHLREELHVIKTERKQEAIIDKKERIKKSLNSFITKCAHMGIDTRVILKTLENLHTKDTDVLSVDEYQWCKEKLTDRSKPDPSFPHEEIVQLPTTNEVNFCKQVVQNSIVACCLLVNERSDMSISAFVNEISLFEGNKSIDFQLDTQAQHKGAAHWYLIATAKGTSNPGDHVIYYIAFGNDLCLRDWSDNYESFKEGIHACRFKITIVNVAECKSEYYVCINPHVRYAQITIML